MSGAFFPRAGRAIVGADISAPAFRLWCALWTFADANGRSCFPAQATLAELLRTDDRSVRRWTRELEDAGLVTMRTIGRRNEYCLHTGHTGHTGHQDPLSYIPDIPDTPDPDTGHTGHQNPVTPDTGVRLPENSTGEHQDKNTPPTPPRGDGGLADEDVLFEDDPEPTWTPPPALEDARGDLTAAQVGAILAPKLCILDLGGWPGSVLAQLGRRTVTADELRVAYASATKVTGECDLTMSIAQLDARRRRLRGLLETKLKDPDPVDPKVAEAKAQAEAFEAAVQREREIYAREQAQETPDAR